MITFTGRVDVATEQQLGRKNEKLEGSGKGRVIISNSVRSNERRIRLIIIESGKRGPLDRGHSGILVGGTRIRCVAPAGMYARVSHR